MCCVDKKGILSWANPTAEKVFFLRNASTLSRTSSAASLEKHAEPSKTNENNKNESNRIPYSQPGKIIHILKINLSNFTV